MKRTAVIFAVLALSATSVMACPYKSKVQASAPDQLPQSTASTEAPAAQQTETQTAQVAQDRTEVATTSTAAE